MSKVQNYYYNQPFRGCGRRRIERRCSCRPLHGCRARLVRVEHRSNYEFWRVRQFSHEIRQNRIRAGPRYLLIGIVHSRATRDESQREMGRGDVSFFLSCLDQVWKSRVGRETHRPLLKKVPHVSHLRKCAFGAINSCLRLGIVRYCT